MLNTSLAWRTTSLPITHFCFFGSYSNMRASFTCTESATDLTALPTFHIISSGRALAPTSASINYVAQRLDATHGRVQAVASRTCALASTFTECSGACASPSESELPDKQNSSTVASIKAACFRFLEHRNKDGTRTVGLLVCTSLLPSNWPAPSFARDLAFPTTLPPFRLKICWDRLL
jgi:hypothetical protein